MRRAIFLTALGLTVVPANAAAARAPLGVFFRWAGFEQASPRNCYAISAPAAFSARPQGRPYVSVGFWPERGLGPQLHVRLSGRRRAGSAVILRIDQKVFQLVGEGADAWAPNAQAHAAIVAALRTGVGMAVETRSDGGSRIRDRYVLRGAASAIDAAAFACAAAPRRGAGKKPQ